MCHDGTGLRGGRAEARLLGVLVKNGPPQTALERRSGRTPTVVILKNRSILADIAVPLLEPGDDQQIRRSGSKSGSGRWSHWEEIGWVHYPEIGWSHSDEIRGVQSLEILHICPLGASTSIAPLPKLAELLVTELRPLGAVFILEVDDDTRLRASESRAAQASADHLFVENLAYRWDGPSRRELTLGASKPVVRTSQLQRTLTRPALKSAIILRLVTSRVLPLTNAAETLRWRSRKAIHSASKTLGPK
jgi:hypothetical protein